MLIALSLLFGTAAAEDLVIDDETVFLSGELEYETVLIMNNARVVVEGELSIKATNFFLRSGCTIFGTGKGHQSAAPQAGGPGAGNFGSDSGGGGAHGGDGGRGIRFDGVTADAFGGEAYADSAQTVVDMGSAGGGAAAGGLGGHGGGAITIEAAKVVIDGVMHMNGEGGGLNGGGAGGGGAGGAILIKADELTCAGTLNALGGPGGQSDGAIGGGGGGGVIIQLHDRPGRPCNTHVDGGVGGGTWSNGTSGVDFIGEIEFDGDGLTYAEGDCQSGIAEAFPGAEELCNDIDDDCDGEIDEDCALPDTGEPAPPEWALHGGTGWRCDAVGGTTGWIGLLALFALRRRA